jgi:hypothetical protein
VWTATVYRFVAIDRLASTIASRARIRAHTRAHTRTRCVCLLQLRRDAFGAALLSDAKPSEDFVQLERFMRAATAALEGSAQAADRCI